MTRPHSQNGSAFFIILIAIMMFAMLSYAVFQGSRGSGSSLSADQARLAAQEIISYSETMAKAVQTLRLRGCTEYQINFAPEYINPSAPADKSCDIFDLSGGKVSLLPPNPSWRNDPSWPHWWINGQTNIEGIGTAEPELILWLTHVKPEICAQLNKLLFGGNLGDDGVGSHTIGFQGTYNLVADGIGDDPGSIFKGRSAGCLNLYDGGYYYTLIAR